MSRKGKKPVSIPKGVEVKSSGNEVSVKGPKGMLTQTLRQEVTVDVQAEQIVVQLTNEDSKVSKFHGLYRTLIENMIIGVTQGFEKKLQMIGVGYRAIVRGDHLDLQVGLSHPSSFKIPQEISVNVEKGTMITIMGADKQRVGQFAADVRAIRPPEPYQGKGIRYVDEYVRRKAGKAAGK